MASFIDVKNKYNGLLAIILVVVPVIVSASLAYYYSVAASASDQNQMTISTTNTTTNSVAAAAAAKESSQLNAILEKFGVKIERNPPQSRLTLLNVTSWPKWGCEPSRFPWTFTATETMFLLEGKVKLYCDGHDEFFEIGAGDLVEFPKGMKVTWDVTEAVNKHYSLEE